MTYFKASGKKKGMISYCLAQGKNPDDIGKDADFLGINFKNQGSDDMRIYGAVIGRGHDSVSKHHEKYFCFQTWHLP